jgi:putative spermidine/putrescine transport system permease protein
MAVVDPTGLSSIVAGAADGPGGSAPATGVRPARGLGRLVPIVVVLACGVFFTFPLFAMARFSLQNVPMVRLGWSTLFDNWSFSGITAAFGEAEFRTSLYLSLKLAAGTVVLTLALLLPTTLWVHLRLPKARAFVEFLTVLPYVIPPIALVAGILPLKPHARWFLDTDYSLIPFYTVLALPFTFRAIDAGVRAIDVRTLVDASRSLGAGWGTTFRRALIPNLRTAIISSSFLTAAVVLGEFTVARVLLKKTMPLFMFEYQQREPQGGMGLGLLALVATTALFALLALVTRKRGAARPAATFV